MNIAFITPRYSNNFWNGTGRCSHDLAQGLNQLGHSVTVYTYNSTQVTKKKKDQGVDEITIGGIASDPKKFGIIFEDVPAWNAHISKELRKEDYNILICFDWFGLEACQRYAESSVNPVSIVGLVSALGNGRGQYVPFSNTQKVAQFLEKERYFLHNCDCLVAFTEGSLAEVKKLTRKICHLVHLSVFPNPIESKPEQGNVLIQGRIARDRYLERGIRAAAELTWISLEICGPGADTPYGQYIVELAKRQDVSDRVKFRGWIEDDKVPAIYGAAELVLCPSVYDPFGYSALDAMAFGVPVVASYESYRGVVKDNKTGLLFQSLPELKTALNSLRSSKQLRESLVASAKQELLESRTIKASVEQFHNILISTANEKMTEYIRV